VTHLEARTLAGKQLRFEAKQYVLAGGGLEVPRLMLLSNDTQPAGVGNFHDNVGRYFMEHPHIWTGYILPTDRRLFERLQLYRVHTVAGTPVMGKFSLRPEVQRREQLLNFATSIHPVNLQPPPDGVRELKNSLSRLRSGRFGAEERRDWVYALQRLPNIMRHVVRKVRRGLDRGYRQRLNVAVMNPMTEQVPNRESRVRLGPEKDMFGQRRMELAWRLTSQDIDSIRRSQEILGAELRRYGLGELVVELRDDSVPSKIHGGWHHMGTTRMDDDAKKWSGRSE
jgi:choline dehydrogenase-like flavoprotein